MKHLMKFFYLVFLAAFFLHYSCQRELYCPDCSDNNNPPVANAGNDTLIILPSNIVSLDGSASYDPENTISTYFWTKISGPSTFNITNSGVSQTTVTMLIQGVYTFELKVTDAGGLFSMDTVMVNVDNAAKDTGANKPSDIDSLNTVTNLPLGAGDIITTIGSKIFFLTFECSTCTNLSRAYYNIYDVVSHTWSVSSDHLTIPRKLGQIVSAGNKIFYAGGYNGKDPTSSPYSNVDIYDASTNTWSSTWLSVGRYDMAGAVLNDKVFFAGGFRHDPKFPNTVYEFVPSDIVDIYNLSNQSFSTARLSEARAHISAVTQGEKIYFAGGSAGDKAALGYLAPTSRIDTYDYLTNTWAVAPDLAVPKSYMASIAVGNKIFWAGGLTSWENWTKDIEIRDLHTQSSSFGSLSQEKYWENNVAVQKNNKLVFFTGTINGYDDSKFDIYDLTTNTLSIGVMPVNIFGARVIGINNTIYIAGGYLNGVQTNKLWTLEF